MNTGDGADKILVEKISADTVVAINTGDDPGHEVDSLRATGMGLGFGSRVNVVGGEEDKSAYNFDFENFGSYPRLLRVNGVSQPGTLQVSPNFGVVTFTVANAAYDVQFPTAVPGDRLEADARVASIGSPDAPAKSITIQEGTGITLDVSHTICDEKLPCEVTYAWDFNSDGLFTELITNTKNQVINLTWQELVEFGIADTGASGSVTRRLAVRATQGFKVSDDEISVTITEAPSTLKIEGDSILTIRQGVPYKLKLSATDPGGDPIVSWTINWSDGTTETLPSDVLRQHFYQQPGNYNIQVVGIDGAGHESSQSKTVTVKVDQHSLDAGDGYKIREGEGVTLIGLAAGTPQADSFAWTVNGVAAGSGSTLPLTWADLKRLGVGNDGTFDAHLAVTYENADGNSVMVISPTVKLLVENVPPTAKLINSGPANQGAAATVSFTEVSDPNDTVFTYEYDFGAGFVTGTATQPVPATLLPGSHPITGRISDGTVTTDYSTTLVINNLPPELSFKTGSPDLFTVNEGTLASRSGTFANPGGGAVTFATSLGTVTQNATAHTWAWSHTPNDNAVVPLPVTITVTDAENSSRQVAFHLFVQNVAPTAVLEVPSNIKEGDAGVTVRLTDVTDASSADTTAGFSYFYDFSDGKGFVSGSATQAVPAAVLADSGEFVIRARVVDKDGGGTELSQTLTVANTVATIRSLSIAPQQISSVAPITLTGSFSGDAGIHDTHNVEISWGDGYVDRLSASNVLGITARGSGYADAPAAQVTGGSGSGMTVTIRTSAGAVIEAVVNSPGTGYQAGDVLTVSSGGGNARITLGAFSQAAGTFSAVHSYAYGSGSLANPTMIKVTVSDNDGGRDLKTLSAAVIGAPTITSASAIIVEDHHVMWPRLTQDGPPLSVRWWPLIPIGLVGGGLIYAVQVQGWSCEKRWVIDRKGK